ncbi:MAG: ribonuclease J, partial [bacterium]
MSLCLKLTFLGGACEFGKNCLALEAGGEMVVVDAGLAFPTTNLPGVDFIIPDFAYIRENREKVRGIVLTHGHEDHIGALGYLLDEVEAPVYGAGLTLRLAEAKLADRSGAARPALNEIREGERLKFGALEMEFVRVNHSIPDNLGFAVRAGGSLVVHSGDYKMDAAPADGLPTDLARFRELGAGGVDLLVCDCTNVDHEETASESVVRDRLEEIFAGARGKIVFSTFASNVQRIQFAFDMAERFSRKVFVLGLSMESVIRSARDSGYLSFAGDILRDVRELDRCGDGEVLVMCTGAQGEPMSALRSISEGQNRLVKLEPDDVVVVSAGVIPGNEFHVNQVINNVCRAGAKVVYGDESGVHVSGHGGAREVSALVGAVNPAFVVPFHGEYRHVRKMREVLERDGFPASRFLIMENGESVALENGTLTAGGRAQAGDVYVDGATVGDVGRNVLKERRELGEKGAVAVSVAVRRDTRELIGSPAIESFGFSYQPISSKFILQLKEELENRLRCEGSLPDDDEEAKASVRD